MCPGGAQEFVCSIKRPNSYFIALLSNELIFSKSIDCIFHNMPDHYYKCLVALDAAKLALWTVLDDCSDDWFKSQLNCSEDQPSLEADHVADIAQSNVSSAEIVRVIGDSGLIAPEVEENVWKRCKVYLGEDDADSTKVYFTHEVPYRGFTSCSQCGCIKYRPMESAANRNEFAVAMHLWHVHGVRNNLPWSDHF